MPRVPQVTADDLYTIHVLRARLAPVRTPDREVNAFLLDYLTILARRCMEHLLPDQERSAVVLLAEDVCLSVRSAGPHMGKEEAAALIRALALHVWRTHGVPLLSDPLHADGWEAVLLRQLGRRVLATAA